MNTINREKVKQTFAEYVSHYNAEDERIKLKIDHTYRVANLCERIAISQGLEKEDIELAWLCGMLHDIGRFEQVRRYNTFSDAESVDHCLLGAEILFGKEDTELQEGQSERRIAEYVPDVTEELCRLLRQVISVHGAYRVPQEYDARTLMFAHILRDADKIDILKVNVEVPLEEIYHVTTQELKQAEVTKEVMESFYEEHAVLRALKKAAVDHVVGHISLVYELVYPISLSIVKEQGYLDQLLHYESDNPVTRQQFVKIREKMDQYIASKSQE